MSAYGLHLLEQRDQLRSDMEQLDISNPSDQKLKGYLAGRLDQAIHNYNQWMTMLNQTDTIERRYWTISEVADELNVATSAIRFWEDVFQVKNERGPNGFRKYTPASRERIHKIHHLLKVEGYTIPGAKKQLKK